MIENETDRQSERERERERTRERERESESERLRVRTRETEADRQGLTGAFTGRQGLLGLMPYDAQLQASVPSQVARDLAAAHLRWNARVCRKALYRFRAGLPCALKAFG